VDYGGNGDTVLGAAVGPNMLSNLDIGVLTVGTNGVSLAKQVLRNVTTEWSNGAAPGNIQAIPPLWELLTVATLPACNAAAKGQQRQVSDAAAAPVYNATAAGGGTLNTTSSFFVTGQTGQTISMNGGWAGGGGSNK